MNTVPNRKALEEEAGILARAVAVQLWPGEGFGLAELDGLACLSVAELEDAIALLHELVPVVAGEAA